MTWRRGTRALRLRTKVRGGNPGQPYAPPTDPGRIAHVELTKHVCGWCGGPNSHTNRTTWPWRVLCHNCMRADFGGHLGYDQWIRRQKAHLLSRRRKWPGISS